MQARSLKLLLVEPDVEDATFIKEALMEIEQCQHGQLWSPRFQPVHVERLSDALDVLAEESFDAALLDVRLPDSHSLHAYLRLREAAPNTAVLLLGGADDDALAISALREGAQDYLLKSELDRAPLARALRNALERQRVISATRSEAVRDPETGFYNERAFHALCEREFALALRVGCDLHLTLVAVEGFESVERVYGRQETRLLRMDAAEAMRSCCEGPEIGGVLAGGGFGVACLEANARGKKLDRRLRTAYREFAAGFSGAAQVNVRLSSASLRETGVRAWEQLFDIASHGLCENGPGDALPAPAGLPTVA